MEVTSSNGITISTPYLTFAEAVAYCRCTKARLLRSMEAHDVTYFHLDAETILFDEGDLQLFLRNYEIPNRYNYRDNVVDPEDMPDERFPLPTIE